MDKVIKICDRCDVSDERMYRANIVLGSKVDSAGDIDDLTCLIDLCFPCLTEIAEEFFDNMTLDDRKEWLEYNIKNDKT